MPTRPEPHITWRTTQRGVRWRTLFAIGTPDRVEVFREWVPFVESVTAKLAVDGRPRGMYASGTYEVGSTTLTANNVAIVF